MRLARKARAFFEKAVELDPGNVPARADLATYDMRAPAFLGGGKPKARRQAEEVLRLDPSRGHELLGQLAESDKNFSAAEVEFRRAMGASAPEQFRARRALSAFLQRRRRFAEARRLWLETLESDLSGPLARFELAGIALASGEGLDQAARDLEAAIDRPVPSGTPRPAEAHARLAELQERLGRRERARAELEEAVRLEPHRAEWRKSLQRLTS
jgi:tetratricopeptide (TPR) repeat protein